MKCNIYICTCMPVYIHVSLPKHTLSVTKTMDVHLCQSVLDYVLWIVIIKSRVHIRMSCDVLNIISVQWLGPFHYMLLIVAAWSIVSIGFLLNAISYTWSPFEFHANITWGSIQCGRQDGVSLSKNGRKLNFYNYIFCTFPLYEVEPNPM